MKKTINEHFGKLTKEECLRLEELAEDRVIREWFRKTDTQIPNPSMTYYSRINTYNKEKGYK